MKKNTENGVHLGNNVKYLMKAFQITQSQLTDKLGMNESQVCNLLQKTDIDDEMLQKIADAMGHGVSMEMIKNYNHEDTIRYIINNYTQNVENGGTGTFIPTPTQNVENGGTGTFIPSPTQKVENGGTGTLIPNQDNSNTFENGSQPTINHYVAEQAFESMKEIAELKTEIMRLRMKYESDAVESEIKKKKA